MALCSYGVEGFPHLGMNPTKGLPHRTTTETDIKAHSGPKSFPLVHSQHLSEVMFSYYKESNELQHLLLLQVPFELHLNK